MVAALALNPTGPSLTEAADWAIPRTLGEYQPSLFAQGLVSTEPCFDAAERIQLDEASWVEAVPEAVRGSDALFLELHRQTAWEAHRRLMFDRWVDEPRLHGALPRLSDALDQVVSALRVGLAQRYDRDFDGGWAALYRDGSDSVAWHGDSIGQFRGDAVVAVLSLGAERKFALRPDPKSERGGRRNYSWRLCSGDMVVMGGACQRDWQHSVPKMAYAGPRISVQFRSPGWDGTTRSARTPRLPN